jgi:hypothetical protein
MAVFFFFYFLLIIYYERDIHVHAICTEKTNFVLGYQMYYLQGFDG